MPDCNLQLRNDANGECGAISDRNFGTATLSRNFDPAALEGWGVRPADWEFGVSVQQEVLPRVSVEVGYFRRWLDNFFVDDNLATVPADFTPFSITAPSRCASAGRRRSGDRRPVRRGAGEVRAGQRLLRERRDVRRVVPELQRRPGQCHGAAGGRG